VTANMNHPPTNWLADLPEDRLLVEISLWSADLGRLEAETQRVEAGTDIFHIDVADGHFSPAHLFFPDLVARLRKVTTKPFHVHLMIADSIVEDQISQYADAGADLISVHAENNNVTQAIAYLSEIDMLTLLGTRIGVKGQGLAEEATDRIIAARRLVADHAQGRRIIVAADGGIREHTVPALRKAGAETVVMGSLAFGAADFPARIAWAQNLASA
jgi:ribulose-phosphate 3-epimerase